jgi:RNA polymerase sigma factor (sigma-70 family)
VGGTLVGEDIAGAKAVSGLAELYERHAPAAGRLAYLLTGDRTLAEDLVQEAFVRVVGRFRHLRVPDAFEAYLRRTIVNLHTSQLRRKRIERAYLER